MQEHGAQQRANYIGSPAFFLLNQACRSLADAFGHCIYLVGSSLHKRDYRDVDIRCILDDDEYARLFPGLTGNPSLCARWSVLCSSISLWLSQQSGLPVDFQIQKQSEANANHPGAARRHPMGIFIDMEKG